MKDFDVQTTSTCRPRDLRDRSTEELKSLANATQDSEDSGRESFQGRSEALQVRNERKEHRESMKIRTRGNHSAQRQCTGDPFKRFEISLLQYTEKEVDVPAEQDWAGPSSFIVAVTCRVLVRHETLAWGSHSRSWHWRQASISGTTKQEAMQTKTSKASISTSTVGLTARRRWASTPRLMSLSRRVNESDER